MLIGRKLRKIGTMGIIGLGLAGILSNYNCSSSKDVAVGENEYYFEDLNLSRIGDGHYYDDAGYLDSISIIYTDSIGRANKGNEEKFRGFILKIPIEKQDHWENEVNLEESKVSFEVEKEDEFNDMYYKIKKETIKIKEEE